MNEVRSNKEKDKEKTETEDAAEDKNKENNENSTTKQNHAVIKRMRVIDFLKSSLPRIIVLDKDIIKLGNTLFSICGKLLTSKSTYLYGKPVQNENGVSSYRWSAVPPHPLFIPTNKVLYVSGAIGAATKVDTELAAFELYFTEHILETILAHTNDELRIAQYYLPPATNYAYPLKITELKAFIGILLLHGLRKHGEIGYDGAKSTVISKERFEYLNSALRFDEYSTRRMGMKLDSFSLIRDIWEEVVSNCSKVYRPSKDCIIDEMYISYNGACPFKLPLPNQLGEYGIKLIVLCDTKNAYIMSAMPYIDKTKTKSASLAEFVVRKTTKPIYGTKTNISLGNDWFTSVHLLKVMLKQHRLKMVGPMRKDHPELPHDILVPENRPESSSIFVYNIEDQLQLCTYYPQKGMMKIMLSNMHYKSATTGSKSIPEVVRHYNSTKYSADKINQMYCEYSCARKTNKWPMCIFYTLLDIAGLNSFTIFNMNRSNYGKPAMQRDEFLFKLALALIDPYFKEQLTESKVNNEIKGKTNEVINTRASVDNDCKVQIEINNIITNESQKSNKIIKNIFFPFKNTSLIKETMGKDLILNKIKKQFSSYNYQLDLLSLHTQANYPLITMWQFQPNLSLEQPRFQPPGYMPSLPVVPFWHPGWSPGNFATQQFPNLYQYQHYLYYYGISNHLPVSYMNMTYNPFHHTMFQIQSQMPFINSYQYRIENHTNIAQLQLQEGPAPWNVRPENQLAVSNKQIKKPVTLVSSAEQQGTKCLQSENSSANPNVQPTSVARNTIAEQMAKRIGVWRQAGLSDHPTELNKSVLNSTISNVGSIQISSGPTVTSDQYPTSGQNSRPIGSTQQQSAHISAQQMLMNSINSSNLNVIFQTNALGVDKTQAQGQVNYPSASYFKTNAQVRPFGIQGQSNDCNTKKALNGGQFCAKIQNTSVPWRNVNSDKWCSFCNAKPDRNIFATCAKCSAVMCTIHQKFTCIYCFNTIQSRTVNFQVSYGIKGKCDICKLQGITVQCCKCCKFLCIEHRCTVCCFCEN